ncbi:trans-aconitate 2-methyltransferase [Paracidovorax anthurii]|uniref:Trans-aconitate 2-methyltransferase n=1 Tax=Paracidovorax anthurii TaxID=78229 RepID=A0A328ZIU0_9BURK|nr:trans-aconitate 2-methyltransferase [Paracidovorax anthurii]RAR86110.1 trans-aconitate 2-methyltransferase [Paracidovorax anthurii]
MHDWNPALYRRFEDERTRPAHELLARVPLPAASRVVDLGCGPGNSTELLARRFPQAHVAGIDTSAAMLQSARERLPAAEFLQADIAHWAPAEAPDLIYANASLQWVGGHESLIPRLFAALAPGGVLAIQMPDNREEPSHRLMREVAAQAPWRDAIGDVAALRTRILGIADYYDLLAPRAQGVDVWHTVYQHAMPSAAAIVEWVRGTGLKPFVDPLADGARAGFLAEYERRIDAAYPARADGRRLLAFPRMFIVARRSA